MVQIVATTDGLRERNKRAARATIRRSALELVYEEGLSRATIDAIATRAQVSPRTFFNYFSSKSEALFGLDPDVLSEALEHLNGHAVESAFEAVGAAMGRLLADIEKDPTELKMRRQILQSEPSLLEVFSRSNEAYEAALVRAVRSRLTAQAEASVPREAIPLETYPELLVAACHAAARTALQAWLAASEISLQEHYHLHLRILERGLGVDGVLQPLA